MKEANNKGITLIALIITVILLICLVALAELIIPDDLFKKADRADKYTVEVVDDTQKYIDEISGSVPEIKNDIVSEDENIENSAPVISLNDINTRGTTQVTINAKATDSDGDSLIYKIYTSTSESGTYTLKQTSSAIAQNTRSYIKSR